MLLATHYTIHHHHDAWPGATGRSRGSLLDSQGRHPITAFQALQEEAEVRGHAFPFLSIEGNHPPPLSPRINSCFFLWC